jgi:hypothetical protein
MHKGRLGVTQMNIWYRVWELTTILRRFLESGCGIGCLYSGRNVNALCALPIRHIVVLSAIDEKRSVYGSNVAFGRSRV